MPKNDIALINGHIYTQNKNGEVAEAIVVKNGIIVYVGDMTSVNDYVSHDMTILDLQGKTVLPGMLDTHIHPPGNKLVELYQIDINGVLDEKETMRRIEAYIKSHPEQDMYYGLGYSQGAFSGEEISKGPKKERLDAICPDKPVIITSFDGHSIWMNSKAFECFGYTKDTVDPENGTIEKDDITGELWGTVKEEAKKMIPTQQFTKEQFKTAIKEFIKMMHSLGYTGYYSNSGILYRSSPFEIYKELEEEDQLKMRITGAMTIRVDEDLEAQANKLIELKKKYDSNRVTITTAKFLVDGVVEGLTAYLLEPYNEAPGKPDGWRGELLWDEDMLKEAFTIMNSAGLQIHVHSIGDGATHATLDALEYAKSHAPEGDYRNTITHLQVVAEDDFQRFKDLDVIANTQIYWHLKAPGFYETVEKVHLGEKRAEKEYPLKTFLNHGVKVAVSSDHWVTPIPHPMYAVQLGVTRNLHLPEYYGVEPITDMDDPTYLLGKEERVKVEDMIRFFTQNNAYQMFMDDKIGTLEVGKYGDMVVVDRNPITEDPLKLARIKILKTIFNGEIVYDAHQ